MVRQRAGFSRPVSHAVPLVLLFAACAGGARAKEDLDAMTAEQLVEEALSPTARAENYVRYDANYRPLVVAALAKRLAWSDEDRDRVLAGHSWRGATTVQVEVASGRPARKLPKTAEAAAVEQWIYGDPDGEHTLVTFTDGRCSGWVKRPEAKPDPAGNGAASTTAPGR